MVYVIVISISALFLYAAGLFLERQLKLKMGFDNQYLTKSKGNWVYKNHNLYTRLAHVLTKGRLY